MKILITASLGSIFTGPYKKRASIYIVYIIYIIYIIYIDYTLIIHTLIIYIYICI